MMYRSCFAFWAFLFSLIHSLRAEEASTLLLDLEALDPKLKGFQGGFSDGVYGYLVPSYTAPLSYSNDTSGKVVRFSLYNFTLADVRVLDLANSVPDLKGFHGGFTDSVYGYLVPFRQNSQEMFGAVVRFSLDDFSTIAVLDVAMKDSSLRGFSAGFTDFTYGYLVPWAVSNEQYSGDVVRFALQDFSAITVLSLTSWDPTLKGFSDGFQSGSYGYLVPNYHRGDDYDKYGHSPIVYFGKIVSFSLSDFGSFTVLDLQRTDPQLAGFSGGFAHDNFGYLVSDSLRTGYVTRFNLTDFSSVEVLDLSSSQSQLKNFAGAFTDGKYGYCVPYGHTGQVGIFSLGDFSRVPVIDVNRTNRFSSGFSDGVYGYLVPEREMNSPARFSGNVVRFNLYSMPKPCYVIVSSTMHMVRLDHALDTQDFVWLNGGITLKVSDAEGFAEELRTTDILEEVLASLLNVSRKCVRNISVSLKPYRILIGRESDRSLLEMSISDLEVPWGVAVSPASNISVTAMVSNFNNRPVDEMTRTINDILAAHVFSKNYTVLVTMKFLSFGQNMEDSGDNSMRSSTSSNISIFVLFLCVVFFLITGPLFGFLLRKCCNPERREPNRVSFSSGLRSLEDFEEMAGALAHVSFREMLNPPDTIRQSDGENVRRFAQAMLDAENHGAFVFLTYAVGKRCQDADSCGPGMYYAASVLKILYDNGVKCFCDLMLRHDAPRSAIASQLRSRVCKVLLVVQTSELYHCNDCLEEIYIAHSAKCQIVPLRFERKSPAHLQQWPLLAKDSRDSQLMLKTVQDIFEKCKTMPPAPYTVIDHPGVLDDLVVELKGIPPPLRPPLLKLRSSTWQTLPSLPAPSSSSVEQAGLTVMGATDVEIDHAVDRCPNPSREEADTSSRNTAHHNLSVESRLAETATSSQGMQLLRTWSDDALFAESMDDTHRGLTDESFNCSQSSQNGLITDCKDNEPLSPLQSSGIGVSRKQRLSQRKKSLPRLVKARTLDNGKTLSHAEDKHMRQSQHSRSKNNARMDDASRHVEIPIEQAAFGANTSGLD